MTGVKKNVYVVIIGGKRKIKLPGLLCCSSYTLGSKLVTASFPLDFIAALSYAL